jgi:Malectin-like domain
VKNRYPDDSFDRWWWNSTLNSAWSYISTSSKIEEIDIDFGVPSIVLETAATTSSIQKPLSFYLTTDLSTKYCFFFYFHEIQTPSTTSRREFNIYVNDYYLFGKPIIPSTHKYNYDWVRYWVRYRGSGHSNYNVTMVPTSNSTLPPLLNAFELYTVASVDISTLPNDGILFSSVKYQK